MLSDGPSADPTVVYVRLYDAHAGQVLSYLNHRLRDYETAQDVAQNAWINALRGLPATLAKGHGVGVTWVMKVATYALYDHYRRVKSRPQTSDLDEALGPGTAFPAALMDGETPETLALGDADDDEHRAAAALLLELVGYAHRRVLWLREWRSTPLTEIARALSGPVKVRRTKEQRRRGEWPSPRNRRVTVTVTAVKSLLFRAHEAQREWWAYNEAQRPRGRDIASRFWEYVGDVLPEDRGPCWRWRGYVDTQPGGAPQFAVALRPKKPLLLLSGPRLAYVLVRGALPPWALLRRTCKDRGCVSPWHTVVVTRSRHVLAPSADPPAAPGGEAHPLPEGEQLRRRRIAWGISSRQLAEAAGLHRNAVAELEHGTWVLPSTRTQIIHALARLCDARPPVLDGNAVHAKRMALGLTITGLSQLASVQWHTLAEIERGKRAHIPSVMRRITDALLRLEQERQAQSQEGLAA